MKQKRKLGRKLLSFLLTLAMVVGLVPGMSLTALATDNPSYTLDGTITGGGNAYADDSDITQNNVSWKVKGNTMANPWRIGGKSLSGENRDVYSTGTINSGITEVMLELGDSTITVNSVTLTVASDSSFSTVLAQQTKNGVAANSTLSFKPTSGTWSNAYYKFTFNVTNSNTSNKYVHFKAAKFYAAAATVPVTGVTLNPSAAQSINVGGSVAFTATVAPDGATDKTVKWSTTGGVTLYSDENCTAGNEIGADATSTLTVYAKGISAGSATVTATSNADSEKKASCDVTVNAPVTKYPLWVGDTQVTSANATSDEHPTWSYDAKTNTLTLNNFSYTGKGGNYNGSISSRNTNAEVPLTINLVGENTVCNETSDYYSYGIYHYNSSNQSLIISGEGSLDVSSINKNGYGIYSPNNDIIINGGNVTATGNIAIKGTVKNAIAGTGWTNKAGTEGKADIAISTGQTLSYKKVQFPADASHTHNFTYSSDGAVITATCSASGCTLTDNKATLTIVKPTLTTYGETGKSAAATLTGLDAFNSATDLTVAASDIKYYGVEEYEIEGHTYKKQGDELAQVPTAAGEYVAGLTLSNVKTSETETGDVIARVWYTIAPASISSVTVTDITAPVATEALDTEAATSTANVTLGAVTWNPTTTPAAYATQYTATVIATAAANYAFADTATATVNGQAATVTKNDGGTLTIAYTFEKTALTPVTITATDKKADWSADGIAIPVEGMFTITEGAGAATYTVTNGTGEGTYDAQTGKLTVTKCGTFTVKVSTAATDTYAAGAETTATLTVNKVDSTAATVTANTLTYTGSAQALVTVTGEATGGEMQYALGTETEATEQYTTSIPTGTEAGTYYVWYKAVGDTNHLDSSPECVTVQISVSFKVTFKVVNGSWDDETTADKTVTLTGYEGDTLKLAANQIPAVGSKPADTYKTGNWDVTPGTDTAITADATYTYTYAAQGEVEQRTETSTLTDVPEALKGTYSSVGEIKQALLQSMFVAGQPAQLENAVLLDIALMISRDGGNTWTLATEANYPEEGILAKLPYPAGTSARTHRFSVGHMFTVTSARLGTVAGEMEYPAVTLGSDYLYATFRGMSPVVIAYDEITHTLTVNYVYADGTQATEPYAQAYAVDAEYSVASPAIDGFTPDQATVSGTMGETDVTVTVTYQAALECAHEAEEIPAVPPTCTKKGSTAGEKCRFCGVMLTKPEPVPALGHDYHEKRTQKVEINQQGEAGFICARCGHTITSYFLMGDVNGDGVVDGRDLLRLARFLAGQDVEIVWQAAEMTGDGEVNGRDLLRLAKYLAGVI